MSDEFRGGNKFRWDKWQTDRVGRVCRRIGGAERGKQATDAVLIGPLPPPAVTVRLNFDGSRHRSAACQRYHRPVVIHLYRGVLVLPGFLNYNKITLISNNYYNYVGNWY